MITKLDMINAAIAAVGLAAVASVDSQHPTARRAVECLERENATLQSEGWYFNQYTRVLNPQVNGEIVVPLGAILFSPDDPQYQVRGNRMFDTRNATYTISKTLCGRIVELLDPEDLPAIARLALRDQLVSRFYIDEDGTDPKLSMYNNRYATSLARLQAENLKHQKINFFDRASRTVRAPDTASGRYTRRGS